MLLLAALVALATGGLLFGTARGTSVTVSPEQEFNVSSSPGSVSDHGRVTVTDDGTVHIVWEEGLDIHHRFRGPDGAWSEAAVLFYGGSQPALATDGTSVAAAYVQDLRGGDDPTVVHVQLWNPVDEYWSTAGAINLSEHGNQPDLAFSPADGALWVTWSDHTYDTGRPYLAKLLGTNVVAGGQCGGFPAASSPSVTVDLEGNVYVARTDIIDEGQASQISYAVLRSGASTCGQDGPPLYRQTRTAKNPDIDVQGDDLCVVWQEGLGPGEEVVLACRRAEDWLSWNMSNSANRSVLPRLVLDTVVGRLAVWQDHSADDDTVMFRQNPPPPARGQTVTEGNREAEAPDFIYQDGTAYTVWTDWSGPDDAEIHFAQWRVDPPTPTPTPSPSSTPTATPTGSTPSPTATTDTIHRIYAPLVFAENKR